MLAHHSSPLENEQKLVEAKSQCMIMFSKDDDMYHLLIQVPGPVQMPKQAWDAIVSQAQQIARAMIDDANMPLPRFWLEEALVIVPDIMATPIGTCHVYLDRQRHDV